MCITFQVTCWNNGQGKLVVREIEIPMLENHCEKSQQVSSGLLKILETSPIEVVQVWTSIWAIDLSAAEPHFSSTIGGGSRPHF